ncbi:AraC family transcriptional regulator [Muriicola sp. Z0-33]|nr:AraC family transcriptional regulator [Muriicola sp. Z0-33]
MLVIQFRASGAYPFLHTPMHELNNKVVPAQELFGNEILELRSAILSEHTASGKFNLVAHWLLNLFDAKKIAPKELIDVHLHIKTTPVAESSQIIASYPNSQKHLIQQFKNYFGLTPKLLHRIYRFNEILKQIQNKQQIKWSQIAYEFGYSDQSHFIKEFKEFSGFNPSEFIDLEFHKDETNFFPLDRNG